MMASIVSGVMMNPKNRIKLLQKKLLEQGLCCALLFYSRDILYYTGTAQPSYLVVLPEDYFLFVRSGFEFALNDVFIEKHKVTEERKLANVYKEMFSQTKSGNRKIATELDILPVKLFYEFKAIFSGYEFSDISTIVLEQRKKKDEFEIARIREACKIVDMGHQAALSDLRDGITELELAASVENAHRIAGHEGIFFVRLPDFFMSRGPISSGPNLFKFSGVVYSVTGVGLSPAVPAGPSRRTISSGDIVVVDIPTMVDGYHADQTRTYILGKADEKLKTMYIKLKEIADLLIKNIKPGMKCSEIYQMAIKKSEELSVAETFLSFGKGKKSRLIGHGVGLELNEPPMISNYEHSEVSDGYVIALEMHMMDKNVGVIKLEDTILIRHGGNEILTKSPRHLFEI